MKLVYSRNNDIITYYRDDGSNYSYECHHDFEEGLNENEEPRATLPNGEYTATAEEYPAENSKAYGRTYIDTGDSRGRVVHGGGSGCEDPFAPKQGWVPTYGCLRMQNIDGEELSRLIIEDGNGVPFTVGD
jgi:hypothetical protein